MTLVVILLALILWALVDKKSLHTAYVWGGGCVLIVLILGGAAGLGAGVAAWFTQGLETRGMWTLLGGAFGAGVVIWLAYLVIDYRSRF